MQVQISQGSKVFPPDTELTLTQQQFAFFSSTAGCRAEPGLISQKLRLLMVCTSCIVNIWAKYLL